MLNKKEMLYGVNIFCDCWMCSWLFKYFSWSGLNIHLASLRKFLVNLHDVLFCSCWELGTVISVRWNHYRITTTVTVAAGCGNVITQRWWWYLISTKGFSLLSQIWSTFNETLLCCLVRQVHIVQNSHFHDKLMK